MIFARIAGTGSYLPGNPVTNADLIARGVETDDEWITSRTGISTRHLAADGVFSSDLAFEASKKAIESAGISAEDIDLIIVATTTPDVIFPSTACLLQGKLGNAGAMAFDVQAVCSGFPYALMIAEKFIASGSHQKALVVGAETFSHLLDWQDRTTCVLFGDGAGAVILEASEKPGILATAARADGSHHKVLAVPGQIVNGQIVGNPFVYMEGQAVFRFAVTVLAEIARECAQLANVALTDIDWLIPHQANIRIIEAAAKKLSLPMEKVIVAVNKHGNTSAASIPLALDVGIRSGNIQRGQTLLLEGIGGGFAWGAVLVKY